MFSIFRKRQVEKGLDLKRIELFSDAVFAIAITLLILEIRVPELSPEALAHGELSHALIELLPKFLSYVISFGIIGIFWMGHHIMFHYIQRAERGFMWLNVLFLMSISFIPFPAGLIGEYSGERLAVLIYGGALFVSSMLLLAMWRYAVKDRYLVDPTLSDGFIKKSTRVLLFGPILYLCAFVAAFFNPVVSIIVYILIPVLYIIPSPVDDLIDAQ